ncbi:MAG TPA: type VI secretion system tube protein Hcp [Propionibacteriaceae bacterium]|nr:type VI secretion system tube protein Hcp [Propionibacteriaceae bacterium]
MTSTWFLAVAGLSGDSTVEGHENELDVDAWRWGISQARSPAGGGATGRPVISDLVLTIASTGGALQLIDLCATGRSIQTAELIGVRAGGSPFTFLRYEMQRLTVTGVSQTTADDGVLRHEVALAFRSLRATFTPQNAKGSAGTPVRVEVGNVIA